MARSFVLFLFLFYLTTPIFAERTVFVPDVSHQVFRDQVVNYVRGIASQHLQQTPVAELNQLERDWDNSYQRTNWQISIRAFHLGDTVGEGIASGKDLTQTLTKATQLAMASVKTADKRSVDDYRFRINFSYAPSRSYTLIDFNGKGLEMVGNRVAVRHIDIDAIRTQIGHSLDYLLRQQSPEHHGFFKFYDADKDQAQTLLRTTYSATALYSLIKLNELQPDPEIEARFPAIAEFLLDRQLQTGPNAGGFDYGFNPETSQETCSIVVGTTSKTIYTLLLMHNLYPEQQRYLKAARAAGDWLLTMLKDNGNVIPIAKCQTGEWQYKDKLSFLYTGQVLSALSRLYQRTGEQSYLQGAHKIAALLLKEVEQQGPLVADDYRPANSISSSWIMMSLIDLAKVAPRPAYNQTIVEIAEALLIRQIDNPQDLFSHGRYLDAMTTSGNGWINEVMGEWYGFCQKTQLTDCEPYRKAMWHTSRWLIQNAYNAGNSFDVKNPERAKGGMITNFNTQTVRTDAVCHGLNGLISLLGIEDNNSRALLKLTERPLREILPLLRAGALP